MVSAAYPVACYVFFFSFTFFILTQSHENTSLNSINLCRHFLYLCTYSRSGRATIFHLLAVRDTLHLSKAT
jgi:hypothetical protein